MCVEAVVWNLPNLGENWRFYERIRKATILWKVRVATEVFSVATELSASVLQQWVLCRDKIWSW